MSGIYTQYKSNNNNNNTESIYASWPKEKNTWGIPPPNKPPLPPLITRNNKPEIYVLKEGYVEEAF